MYIWQKSNRLLLGTGRMPHPVVGAVDVTNKAHRDYPVICSIRFGSIELSFTLHSPSVYGVVVQRDSVTISSSKLQENS